MSAEEGTAERVEHWGGALMTAGIALGVGWVAYELYQCHQKHGSLNVLTLTECLGEGVANTIADQAKDAWNSFKNSKTGKWLEKAGKTVGKETVDIANKVKDTAVNVEHKVVDVAKDAEHGVEDAAKKVNKTLGGVPKESYDFTKALGKTVLNEGKEIAKVINVKHDVEEVKKAFKNPKKAAEDFGKTMVSATKPLRKFFHNSKVSNAISKEAKKVSHTFHLGEAAKGLVKVEHKVEHKAKDVVHKVESGVKKAAHKVKHFFHSIF